MSLGRAYADNKRASVVEELLAHTGVSFERLVRSALASALLATVTAVTAQGETLSMSFDSLDGCPTRTEFWSQLQLRSERLKRDNPGDREKIAISVRVVAQGAQYLGWLKVVDASGASVERSVPGSTCSDVSAALALIGAVILDGTLEMPGSVATPPKTQLPKAEPPKTEPPKTEPPKTRRSAPRISVGPIAGLHGGIAPGLAPILGVASTFRGRRELDWAEIRLEGLVGWSPEREVAYGGKTVGRAQFLWLASRISGCAMPIGVGSLRLGPCVLTEVGGLRGTGNDGSTTRHQIGTWFAPGLMLNGELMIGPVELRLGGGAVRPLVRDRFMFSAHPVIAQAPTLAMTSELQLSWTID